MSLPVSSTGASPTNPKRPERRKSRAPRRLPATEAQQHDIVHDIVLETAVTVAPDPARNQMPVDGLPTAAVIDQMWQANPLQKLLPVDWEAITQALSTLGARSMADPVNATTVAAKLNMRLWQEAAETWIGAAARCRITGWRRPMAACRRRCRRSSGCCRCRSPQRCRLVRRRRRASCRPP